MKNFYVAVVHPLTTLTVANHNQLRSVWKANQAHAHLIKSFHCEIRLTESQYQRLPAALRAKMPDGREATAEVPM